MGYPGEPQDPVDPGALGPPAWPTYAPPASPTGPALPFRVGARGWGRPLPRLGVALAGAGAALAALGVLIWGADLVGGVDSTGVTTARQLLAVLLAVILVAGGYLVAAFGRSSPLASAGVAASGLGIPLLLGFASYSTDGSGPPVSTDAVALVSLLVWALSYLFVPPVAGHTFYLGLGTVTAWSYVIDKAEPTLSSFPLLLVLRANGAGSDGPDLGTVAALSLTIGLGYYLVAFLLDRAGRSRPAVPFVVAGFLAVVVGLLATLRSLHPAGTGVLTIVVAAVLAWYGVRAQRRFTGWAWVGGLAVGVLMIVDDVADQNATAAGIVLLVGGAGLVAAGQAYAVLRGEPEDVDAAPPRAGLAR